MTDSPVVGSAAFELRASKDKIPADLEDAKRIILESAKKTEADLGEIVGTGTERGAKKAAAALKEPQAAGVEAGNAIRDSMQKAGAEIGEAVAKGAGKAKAELEQLAQKAREVQQIKLPTPTIPTEATHTLTTNPINGVQSWAPNDLAGPRSVREPSTAGVTAPELKQTAEAAKETAEAVADIAPAADSGAAGLGRLAGGSAVAGLAAGALIGGAVLVTKTLFDMGRAAMQSAGEISDSAKKIGVSTDLLQEFRHVAVSIGEDAGAADQALGSFADKLAAAGSGLSKEAVKDFAALRITPEQIKSFKTTEEALDFVIDRIEGLKSETDRVDIARRLGLGPLAVALKGNAGEIARLRDEAQKLGVVMDAELVRRGADAQAQFETLSRVIDISLKGAFLDLAPAIVAAISLVAQLARSLSDALDQWRQLDRRTGRGLGRQDQVLSAEQKALIDLYGSPDAMRGQIVQARKVEGAEYSRQNPLTAIANRPRLPSVGGGFLPDVSFGEYVGGVVNNLARPVQGVDAYEHFQALNSARTDNANRRVEIATNDAAPPRQDRAGGTNLVTPPGRERVDRSAEREARRAERVQEEINRLKSRELQIAQDDLLTVQQRYDLREQELRLARAGEDADLKSRLARKDLNQSEFDQLTSQNTINRNLEDRIGSDLLGRDLADERLAQERALSDLTADLLSLQSGAARTAGERRRIEIEMLEMAQEQRRKDLKLRAEREQWSPERLAEALGKLDQIDQGERKATNKATMSPLEEWRDRSLNDAKEVEEAYERIAANGLDALNDGIVDAIMNTRSLGETFSQVAKQILADLLSIQVRRGITEPLANALFGGGSPTGGAGSSMFAGFGSWLKGKIPGFSSGIENFGGGLAYVHAGEVLANLPKGTDVIPAHAVQGIGSRGAGNSYTITGNLMTPEFWAIIERQVAAGEARVRGDVPGLAVNAVRDAQERFAY
ncbi:hypothetical protein [Brevundimonas sp.]|uniref:hypothetical protein n=1 Tax=Brevundimonas sp. TaxID=1871086 RepID=UPI00289FD0FC|nr:hypothetical protein [Brevundimonas sp.]